MQLAGFEGDRETGTSQSETSYLEETCTFACSFHIRLQNFVHSNAAAKNQDAASLASIKLRRGTNLQSNMISVHISNPIPSRVAAKDY